MQIDQFESHFKSAVKEQFEFAEIVLRSIVLVCDLDAGEVEALRSIAERLLPNDSNSTWTIIGQKDIESTISLVERVNEIDPDIIVACRNIRTDEESLKYGLSNYVDALTQACTAPVLLLPDLALSELETSISDHSDVMVQTNHLTGDSRLINWGVAFAGDGGNLFLTHIEDDAIFDTYMTVISKIPELNTELARETIAAELLKEPSDFIENAKKVLNEKCSSVSVKGLVKLGHTLEDYRKLLDRHQIDLVIINTKVNGQLAMGGRAYAIAVQFKHCPLLLL
jgi:uncharacterized protein (UPF0335 family)